MKPNRRNAVISRSHHSVVATEFATIMTVAALQGKVGTEVTKVDSTGPT